MSALTNYILDGYVGHKIRNDFVDIMHNTHHDEGDKKNQFYSSSNSLDLDPKIQKKKKLKFL